MTGLQDWLAGPDPDWLDTPEPPPAAADSTEADRWLRHLGRLDAEAADIERQFADEIERMRAWREDRLSGVDRRRERLRASLAAYHAAVLELDPKAKTITLPSGTLKARAQQDEWTVDADQFIPWAADNAPDLLRVPEPQPAPDKTALKQAVDVVRLSDGTLVPVTAEGEPVPGVVVIERGPKFTVEAS